MSNGSARQEFIPDVQPKYNALYCRVGKSNVNYMRKPICFKILPSLSLLQCAIYEILNFDQINISEFREILLTQLD